MLKETGCIQIETELISGLLRAIPGVQAIAIFREMKEKGKIRVSLRSVQEVDVREVASSFGGGGHSQAAGCTVQGRLEDVEDQVLLKMEEVLSDVETARY
jgi:phosphoesterase RecJ-like protein